MSDDRIAIARRLHALLAEYEPPLIARTDVEGRYELWTGKEVEIEGRKHKELQFAAVIVQHDYVGLYFMPVYTETEMKKVLPPALLELLTGKSCFHIKELSDDLERDVAQALAAGFEVYRKHGWV